MDMGMPLAALAALHFIGEDTALDFGEFRGSPFFVFPSLVVASFSHEFAEALLEMLEAFPAVVFILDRQSYHDGLEVCVYRILQNLLNLGFVCLAEFGRSTDGAEVADHSFLAEVRRLNCALAVMVEPFTKFQVCTAGTEFDCVPVSHGRHMVPERGLFALDSGQVFDEF